MIGPKDNRFRPDNTAQIADVVSWAVSHGKPLELVGRGSKRRIGRAAQYEATLDLSGLDGITLYEPEELVLSAKAGTPMAEIEQALDENNQELAFEPPDFGPLLGEPPASGSIGGTLACNLGGPRRLKSGAARDHFLGFTAVSGRGEVFKSGGRVVKNVTGYDLCKVLAGSWGTLAAMADVTVKVLPAAETQASVVVHGLEASKACEAMAAATGSAYEVSAAAHLPLAVAVLSDEGAISGAAKSLTVLRVEGIEPSVRYRSDRLRELLVPFGQADIMEADASRLLWREVRDVTVFADDTHQPVWRISVPPASGAIVLDALTAAADATGYLDWAGGLIWLRMDAGEGEGADGGAAIVRAAIAECGGHATLMRGSESLRAALDVFQPLSDGIAGLSERLKHGFDPEGVLTPGRMHARL